MARLTSPGDSRGATAAFDERPLTARSVLASTLLGATPPQLPVAQLVHVAGLFAVNENRARVALSRMVASGEATTDGAGTYRLAGHLLQRQQRQAESRAGRTGTWNGRWHVVVLGAGAAAADVRGQRRRALVQARLAELRQGVWMRPDNLPLAVPAPVVADAVVMAAEPVGDARAQAGRLWDLDGWSARALALLARMEQIPMDDAGQLAPGFVLSAAVLRHLQADPLLPGQMLPRRWPGNELRRRYELWDARYREVLARWSRAL